MPAGASSHASDVVSLDDYRRRRAARTELAASLPPPRQPALPAPAAMVAGPVWVYWVPVWIW